MNEVILTKTPPKKYEIGKVYQYERKDGLMVFLDGDKELDDIRLSAPKAMVIYAVAVRRAQQIARNYARKYAPELLDKFQVCEIKNTPRIERVIKG